MIRIMSYNLGIQSSKRVGTRGEIQQTKKKDYNLWGCKFVLRESRERIDEYSGIALVRGTLDPFIR